MDKKIILAIDDEKDNHTYIQSILEDENITIITALDGEEGFIKAKENKPDLIILDIEMPKKDGFATFRDLKTNDQTKDIPIVMLTGITEKKGIKFSREEMGQFYGVEPEDYIEKPIDPEKFIEVIKKNLL